MSADQMTVEEQPRAERGWLRTVLLMAVPLAAAWAIAFWITGLLWWDAEEAVQQVPPPEASRLQSVDADAIDLERYTKAHPSWAP